MPMSINLQPLEDLLQLIESDVGVNGNCTDEPDDEPVALTSNGPSEMTFGHVRRARVLLNSMKTKRT